MRKKISLLSAFIFLLSSTELHELARLPQLIGHYIHHHRQNPSMNLAAFIHLHYQNDHPSDNDEREDGQLPFKSGIDSVNTDITNSILPAPLAGNSFVAIQKIKTYCPEGVPLHRAYIIFHPPRTC
jgi:hypothetical protein